MAAVASKNPFALLDEEDTTPAAPSPAKKAAASEPASKPKSNARGGPASRGGRYYNRGGARASIDANPNQDGIQEPLNGGKRFSGGEGRGRGRGRGGRGGRNERPDRHSQTGKTDSGKKVHQGWGGDDGQTELKDETNAATDATKEATTTSDWDAPASSSWDNPDATPADGNERPGRKEREPEPEDNTLTLEQYKAQGKGSLDVVPELEARQVDADWKDVKPLEKEDQDDYFVGKTKSTPKARAQAASKETVEVNFTTPQRPDTRGGRGRGGRGGRGGERGGRGRGGNAVGNRGPRQSGPSINDESAFPALS